MIPRNPLPTVLPLVFLCLLIAERALALPLMYLDVGGLGPDGEVQQGESVTVSVFASDVPIGTDSKGLFSFGFGIAYDNSGLDATSLDLGALWQATGIDASRDDPGFAGLSSNRFFMSSGPHGDDILLGTIDFLGLSPGTYFLTLGHFTGSGDTVLFDGTSLDDSAEFFSSGSVEVVPEPGTFVLISLGMAILGVRSRR